jgi:acyl-CoA synthetase (NDP forming)
MDAIARLLKPRSVAVIGASADASKTAGLPVRFLLKHEFRGDIWPVNPRLAELQGLPCFPDVAALPAAPDVGLVLLGAARASEAVRALAARGTPAAIVVASGFSETGEEGRRRQRELREAAGPMRLLGPNTIGLVNVTDGLTLSVSSVLEMDHFPVGGIGVVSQSGGILGSLLSRAAARGIGLSKLVSTGNEVDLELADFVDHLTDDPDTKVIALYVESVRNGAAFREAALKATRAGKPIVAYKVGRSAAGMEAAASHTGALAGSDRMYDAMFADVGVIRAETFSELLDIPAALVTGRVPKGRRVAILTSTGGAGTLIADSLNIAGLTTPPPDPATAERLEALLPGDYASMDRNPIDVTLAGLQPKVLRGCIEAMQDSASYDSLVIIVGSSGVAQPALMADAIGSCLARSDKPVIAYVSPHAPAAASLLTERGVPAFAAPESCAMALAGMLRVHAAGGAGDGRLPATGHASRSSFDSGRLPAKQSPPIHATVSLDEAEAKALFARFGVPCVAERIVATPLEAEAAARELGASVALKILSGAITHKSDIGGVAIGLSPDLVADRLLEMQRTVADRTGRHIDRFIVQEMVPAGGIELILGLKRDPLGTAILLGLGGVTAELYDDTALVMLPSAGGLPREKVATLIRGLKAWPLLDGWRGRPKADVRALSETVVAFARMADTLGPKLLEAEINPLFVLPDGQGVRAADGVVVMVAEVP